jgi:chromosome segregation ATPase
MASTPGKSAKQQPSSEGPWTKAGVIATAVFGALSLVLAAAIFQVSELGADVRATNSRIDQTYSTLLQQESDIGSIKGDLRSATDKITAAADRSDQLSNRLTGIVDKQGALVEKQDAQIASIQEIKDALPKLFDAVGAQRDELIKIEDKMGIPTQRHLPPKEK